MTLFKMENKHALGKQNLEVTKLVYLGIQCLPLIRESWPYISIIMSTMYPTTVNQNTASKQLRINRATLIIHFNNLFIDSINRTSTKL